MDGVSSHPIAKERNVFFVVKSENIYLYICKDRMSICFGCCCVSIDNSGSVQTPWGTPPMEWKILTKIYLTFVVSAILHWA